MKKIDIRKIVIVIVIAACVTGGIAASKITFPQNSTGVTTENGNRTTTSKEKEGTSPSDAANNQTTDTQQADTANQSNSTNKSNNTNQSNIASASNNANNANNANNKNSTNSKDNTNATNSPSSSENQQKISCTLTIRCDSVSGNGLLTANGHPELETYASNPQILSVSVEVPEGSSAYDALVQACKDNNIPIESSYTPAYKSYYVEGINYLYERMAGSSSGWTYQVNGQSQGYGASSYLLEKGDVVQWNYVTSQ